MKHSVYKQIVVLGMFDVSHLGGAMAVRIHNLYQSLNKLTPTTLLSGNRNTRRKTILQYLIKGGLQHTRAIYVEASTSTATEVDLALLTIAHKAHIPIIIFIPDAYQFFPDLYPRTGLKVKLLDWGWQQSITVYLRTANMVVYPSWGLAKHFNNHQINIEVFPPAGLAGRDNLPLLWDSPTIVYVGAASLNDGSDLLLDAMSQVVQQFPTVRCQFITPNPQANILKQHPVFTSPWLTCRTGGFDELPNIMQTATILVIPRRRNSYNDLAMPVKQFDYMSFGRPLVVTNCHETANFISTLKSGLVVEDNADSLAAGIMQLLANPQLAEQMGQNGYQAIQTGHAWHHRAARLLQMIETIEHEHSDAYFSR